MFSKFFSHKSSAHNVDQPGKQLSRQQVEQIIAEALSGYRSEVFAEGVLAIACAYTVEHNNKALVVNLTMPFPCVGELQFLATSLAESLACSVDFVVTLQVEPVRQHRINGIKNIIAIASGKGGVGKSTTAVNLAYALMAEGASVGILDADIYGPSIPTMLGFKDAKPSSTNGKTMTPINALGLSAMSIGFLVPEDDATVWRGPMASTAFNQLLNETDWPGLDYLIIDMPPGTGDIQLTLAQKVPVAAAVIVTTPQDIALADAIKGIAMFDKVQVPVLGVIENMSYHICQQCGHQSSLFGHDGGAFIAQSYHTRLLGQLPLDIAIREDADLGKSPLLENSTGEIALRYRKIARNVAAELFYQLDSRSPQTPAVELQEE